MALNLAPPCQGALGSPQQQGPNSGFPGAFLTAAAATAH
jgi:hypothetical protein